MTYIFTPGRHNVTAAELARVYQPGGAAGNGLLNNLIAYWPGNEVAGNALDLHVNGLTLTDTNTVTSNPGLVYPLARQYTAANSEYHTRPGDDALLSTGDVDFTIAAWVRKDTSPAELVIASKWGVTGEYRISTLNDTFLFAVRPPPGTVTTLVVSGAGYLLNVWYLVLGWHDSVANTINVSVNDSFVTAPYVSGVFDGPNRFMIGTGYNAAIGFWNGRIGPTMFWKSLPGLGGVLTAAQRTALYNAGAGLTYTAFTL